MASRALALDRVNLRPLESLASSNDFCRQIYKPLCEIAFYRKPFMHSKIKCRYRAPRFLACTARQLDISRPLRQGWLTGNRYQGVQLSSKVGVLAKVKMVVDSLSYFRLSKTITGPPGHLI